MHFDVLLDGPRTAFDGGRGAAATAAVGLAGQLIQAEGITEDVLILDSTLCERYGSQQGARKGYNPKKPGRPEYAQVQARLRAQLRQWQEQTRDPLLDANRLAQLTAEVSTATCPKHVWKYHAYMDTWPSLPPNLGINFQP